jgi:hypothetical protein
LGVLVSWKIMAFVFLMIMVWLQIMTHQRKITKNHYTKPSKKKWKILKVSLSTLRCAVYDLCEWIVNAELSFPWDFRTIDLWFRLLRHILQRNRWSQLGTGSISTVAFPTLDEKHLVERKEYPVSTEKCVSR